MIDFMKHFQRPFIGFAIYMCVYMYIYVSVYIYSFNIVAYIIEIFNAFCIYVHICSVYFVCTWVVY